MDNELLDKYIRFIETVTGLTSPDANHAQVRRTVRTYTKNTGLGEKELLSRLWSDEKLEEQFLNDVLIGETYFFREVRHFDLLRSKILPELFASLSSIKVWTPSCSTGEEAVSLAMILEDFCSIRRCGGYKVFATDINSKALSRLENGKYPFSSLRQDGKKYHKELLERYCSKQDEYAFTIAPKLLNNIETNRLNFFSDPQSKLPKDVHILFFRNTLVYFSENKRLDIIDRLVSRMAPGGYLFLSSGEIPFVSHTQLQLREYDNAHVLKKLGGGEGEKQMDLSSVNAAYKSMRSGGM